MNPTVVYEAAALAMIAAIFAADRLYVRRKFGPAAVAVRGQAQMVVMLGVFMLAAVLLIVVVVNVFATKTASAAKGCMTQEQSIYTALLALNTATNTQTAIAGKTVAPGLLINGSTDYLPQATYDPLDNTSQYTLTASTTNGVYSAVITCGGVHSKDDVAGQIKTGTYSAGHIIDTNGAYSYN
jgi:competence protein ComGC